MKVSNLPKTVKYNDSDLITIVQGGSTKTITAKDFLNTLSANFSKVALELRDLREEVSKNTLNKANPVLSKPLKIGNPISAGDAATKNYVDLGNSQTVKLDGSSPIIGKLTYSDQFSFQAKDLITKKYADDLLNLTMKTVQTLSGNSFPKASAGDVFISKTSIEVFASDGPALQEGDVLICLEESEGGTNGEVGKQFAIINTNVVSATESLEGTIRIATDKEVREYSLNAVALTPKKFKDSLDASSLFNRTLIAASTHDVIESEKGILAIDNRKNASEITLPSVSSLTNPNMFKVVIKDEFGAADLKNITIKALGSTIDSKPSIVLSNQYQAVTVYNDGKNYYIENNTHSTKSSSGSSATAESSSIIQSGTIQPSAVDTDITMYAASIDLSDYDVNQGFVVEVSGFFADNTNNKDVAIHIGSNVTVSTATTAAPQNDAFTARVTVIKAYKYAVAYGYVLLEGIAADTYRNNILELDWSSTIKVSAVANTATAVSNIKIDSMIVTPLK